VSGCSASAGLYVDVEFERDAFTLVAAFDAAPGETVVLLGPNGAGKTTCLHLIAGLLAPKRGRVALDGAVLCDTAAGVDVPAHERHVGLSFQDFALFPHRTVRENVEYGPRARGRPRAEARRVAAHWLERLDLADISGRKPLSLSGGQQQRVALARALASGARALLLDEPLASLDAATRATVRANLRAFLRGVELPTVVVVHDPIDAFVLGDRLAILESGRIVQIGSEADLLAHPGSPFVAELVGLNFYEATLAPGRGVKEARAAGATFHVLADDLAGLVRIAFAPSDVALAQEAPAGSFQNVFPATVREILSMQSLLRVMLDAGVPMASDITREAARALRLAPGARVWALVKATSIRVHP
jgi:molybdate transport system ATP-binding protein